MCEFYCISGNRPITAESLMSIILDSEHSETSQTPRRPSESSITNALNITTRDQSALQDRNQMNLNTGASDDSRKENKKDTEKSKKSAKTPHASKKAGNINFIY